MVSNLGTHILNILCSNSMSFVAYPKLQMGEVFGGIMKSRQMRWGVVWMWGYLITQFKYVLCYHFPHISSPSKRPNNEFLPSQAQISISTHCLRLERQQHPTKCDFQFIYLMKCVMKQIAILTK